MKSVKFAAKLAAMLYSYESACEPVAVCKLSE